MCLLRWEWLTFVQSQEPERSKRAAADNFLNGEQSRLEEGNRTRLALFVVSRSKEIEEDFEDEKWLSLHEAGRNLSAGGYPINYAATYNTRRSKQTQTMLTVLENIVLIRVLSIE